MFQPSWILNFNPSDRATIRREYQRGNYLDALECLIFSIPSAYFRSKIYRKYLVSSWRIKSYIYFPAKYWITGHTNITVIELFKKYYNFSICSPLTADAIEVHSTSDAPILIGLGTLPREIWIEISKNDINLAKLVRLNKAFCETFAPFVYEELDLLLTLSSTEKMRLNDACFLKYGDDFPDRYSADGYSIYERFQKGHDYEYESLNVSSVPEIIENNKNSYDRLITDGNKIAAIFERILGNKSSILKPFVKNVSITIQVLHGFENLFQLDLAALLDTERLPLHRNDLISRSTADGSIEVSISDTGTLRSLQLSEQFDRDRWELPWSVLYDNFNTYTKLQRKTIYESFPTNVYNREMTSVALVLEFLQNNEKRKALKNITNLDHVKTINPFYEWEEKTRGVRSNLRRPYSMAMVAMEKMSRVQIKSREFVKKKDAIQLLELIVNSCTSRSEIDFTLMISSPMHERIVGPDIMERPDELLPFNRRTFYDYRPVVIVMKNRSLVV